jgi:hypothetical protein
MALAIYDVAHQHAHFLLRVIEQGGDYLLDPWILFWKSFRQAKRG